MPEETEATLLARIDERTQHLDKWKDEHSEEDKMRFDRTFAFVKDSFTKLEGRMEKMDKKLDTLWDTKNQQQGAYSASKIAGAGIWALIVIGVTQFINWIQKS